MILRIFSTGNGLGTALACLIFLGTGLAGGSLGCGGGKVDLPVCGNGEVEGRELCDDGNLEPGDGCDENCLMESRELCDNRMDDDGDGSADCADPDCFTNPLCDNVEVCSNGFDDDGDELVDCEDPDCDAFPVCVGEEICDNGLDDDDDGEVDCDDSNCNGHPACGGCDPEIDFGVLAPGEVRSLSVDTAEAVSVLGVSCGIGDGAGNYHVRFEVMVGFHLMMQVTPLTGDLAVGVLREEEPGATCEVDPLHCLIMGANPVDVQLTGQPPGVYRVVVAPTELGGTGQIQLDLAVVAGALELCDNGVDDDGDGDVDCDDADCAAAPECIFEICDNGVDDDGDGDVDCADVDCAVQPPCLPPEVCDNGVDDDGDGKADCADSQCVGTAGCAGSDCVVNVSLGVLDRGDVVVGGFDTGLATDDNDTSCGGTDGPEVVLSFELSSAANVGLTLSQAGDHVVALTAEAGAGSWCDTAELDCLDPGGSGRSAHTTYLGLPAARYFILVDAMTGDRTGIGTVELAVYDPLFELCADGVDDDGDGDVDCADADCVTDPICLPEVSCHDDADNDADDQVDCADFDCVGSPACGPGACVPNRDLGVIQPGAPALVTVDTTSAPDVFSASCARGGGGGDVVVTFELAVAGDLFINGMQQGFSDHAVALGCQAGPGSACDAAEHACSDGGSPGLPIATLIPDVPPGVYFLVVEPYSPGGAGSITLEVGLQ